MVSRARRLAALFSPSGDENGEIQIGGGSNSISSAPKVAQVGDLPITGNEGDQYFVQSNGYLYIWNGAEWDQIEKTSRSIATTILFGE